MKPSRRIRAGAPLTLAAIAIVVTTGTGCPDRHLLGGGPPDAPGEMFDRSMGVDEQLPPDVTVRDDGGPPDVPVADVEPPDGGPVADVSVAADEIVVCDTRFGTLQDFFLVNDMPTGTVPNVQPMNAYRIAGIQLGQLYSGASQFPAVMNRVFAQSFCTGGGPEVGEMDVILRFEWRQGGQGRLTACQGMRNESDGSFSCVAGTSAMTDAGRNEDRPGYVTWATNPVRVPVPLTIDGAPYTFHLQLRFNGFQQPIAGSGNLVSPGEVVAAAADLCSISLTAPALVEDCDGVTEVNLLDLIDGPVARCGQDRSASTSGPSPTCDTPFADPYNLPDNYVKGLEPSTGWGIHATIELTPVQLVP